MRAEPSALAYIELPAPELRHGWYNVRPSDNAVQEVVRAGASVAKEVEAHCASARLNSAAARVNVPAILAQRSLERVTRYLVVQHVLNHGTHHRGQLTHLLRDFGLAAPSTDFLIFIEDRRKA